MSKKYGWVTPVLLAAAICIAAPACVGLTVSTRIHDGQDFQRRAYDEGYRRTRGTRNIGMVIAAINVLTATETPTARYSGRGSAPVTRRRSGSNETPTREVDGVS